MPNLGVRKIYHLIKDALYRLDIKMGRDKLFDLCKELELTKTRKKRYKSGDDMLKFIAPNLLKNVEPIAPNVIWYTDITYLKYANKHAYLSLIIDHYSRKIIGWNLADTMETEESIKALNMAICNIGGKADGVIHHSDRGSQYRSKEYITKLRDNGITQSMTDGGKPYQNAINERINGILKHEFGLKQTFINWQSMVKFTREGIDIYNNHRPHTSLKYQTPSHIYQNTASNNGKIMIKTVKLF